MNLVITGTSTEVGKTFFTTALLRALDAAGIDCCGYKPFCSGTREDVQALLEASTPQDPPLSLDELNPCFFKSPASPLAASMIEGKDVNLVEISSAYVDLATRFETVIVEGVGGWEVPITAEMNFGDFAAGLGLPVVLVVDNKLGALNHTILTVNAIRARGLECLGIVLNYPEEERDSASISNRAVLDQVLDVPVLLDLMHGETEIDPAPFC